MAMYGFGSSRCTTLHTACRQGSGGCQVHARSTAMAIGGGCACCVLVRWCCSVTYTVVFVRCNNMILCAWMRFAIDAAY
jgi:hypothetical protein